MGTLDWTKATISQGFGPTDEPLDGPYNGYSHYNKGYDFAVPMGTQIGAAAGGTVISAGDSGDGWGVSVKILDGDGVTHNYGHLDATSLKPGDRVEQGQVVGTSGNSGHSTGPHLSYDVWDSSGKFFDPGRYVGGAQKPGQYMTTGSEGRAGIDLNGQTGTNMSATSAQEEAAAMYDQQAAALMDKIKNLSVNSPEVVAAAKAAGISPSVALGQVRDTLLTTMSGYTSSAAALRDYSSGIYTTPDGHIIPLTALPKETLDAINANNQRQWEKDTNTWALDVYKTQSDSAIAAFNAKLGAINASLGYDTNAVARANADINRTLGGLGESRARASFIADFKAKMAPWQTAPGKSSFSANDLGFSFLAKMIGMDPSQAMLNYTGTETVDPAALMSTFDQQLGVTGELPRIPAGITNPDDLLSLGLNLPPVPSLASPSRPALVTNPARVAVGAGASAAPGAGAVEFPPSATPTQTGTDAQGRPILSFDQRAGSAGMDQNPLFDFLNAIHFPFDLSR